MTPLTAQITPDTTGDCEALFGVSLPWPVPAFSRSEEHVPALDAGERIPYGCNDCYKVRVAAKTMYQLMALVDFSSSFSVHSKVGSEVDNFATSCAYADYFYVTGLDEAHNVYSQIREALANYSEFGSTASMSIKRGCTNYEHRFGPSNKWTFAPELAATETVLEKIYAGPTRFAESHKQAEDDLNAFVKRWARDAYRIGDETYCAYIGDEELHPPVVTYHD